MGEKGDTGARGEAGESGPDPWKRMLVIFLFTVAVFALLSWRQEIATNHVEENSRDIAALQKRTSEEVLCPLYGLFLASVKNPDPERVDTPKERKQYAGYLKIIQTGYDALGCGAS